VSGKRAILFVLAASTLAAQKLAFDRVALHQFEDGPVLAPTYEFVPGETVYFSCRIIGYRLAKADEHDSVKLTWNMRMLDPSGVPLEKEKSGKIEDTVLPQDKDWKPKFLASFIIPGFVASGTYHIPVTVKDEVAAAEISTELAFKVRGHDVEPSDQLVVRNFQFLRAEDDRVPMRPAIYHSGDMLWARFDITGYKLGENHHFSVSYGLAILNAAGEQLFTQPDAASDEKESFYPQRYVPGVLSLSLNQGVVKAAYTLVVTIRDKVGNQTVEARQPFEVQ
jgi:hypothetical protein